jgi:hypothetical protein
MIIIAKGFKTCVPLWNLGLSLGKIHCSPKKLHFSPGNNYVPEEKKFNLPWGTI